MRFRFLSLVLLLLLATSAVVLGQETTGTISGRVLDAQDLPVPGATVVVTGPQGSRTATADASGRYSVPFLTPGTYGLKVELQGFRPFARENIGVSIGQTITITARMEVGGLAETVSVVGVSPLIDVTSTTTGSILTSELFEKMPSGRRMSDTLYMAPGVGSSGSAGSANPSLSGGSGLDNQYVVDGANVTNQGYGALGSYSIVFGSLGNATPFDFIQEVQVKTGGYEAEFGQATGGVINVVTKSGSNQIRGSAFGYMRPEKTEGAWTQVNSPNGSVNTTATRVGDFGAEGGGPIMKDHLFFFGAIDPSWDTRSVIAPNDVANFPLYSLGSVNRDRRTTAYSAKATAQLSSAHRFDVSFFGDPSKGTNGPQRPDALMKALYQNGAWVPTAFSSLTYGGHNQAVRYNGILSNSFLVEAYFARALNDINEVPQVNSWSVTDQTVVPNVRSGGIGFYEAGNHSLNKQYSVKLTNSFGGHELKYGLEYDNVDFSNINQRTGPTFMVYPNGPGAAGVPTATGASVTILSDPTFGKVYRVTRANLNSARTTTQKYFDFFVQDTWRAGSRLTINPGIRYEQEALSGTVIEDWKLKNNWAPRLGATYDLRGDGKTKLYGNFGLYYSRVPNDLAARALSVDAGVSLADYYDAALTQAIPNGVMAGSTTVHYKIAGTGADVIDPSTKLGYTREVILGFEHQIMANTTIGARYISRRIPRVLEDVANCPMVAYDLYPSACASVEYILTNPNHDTPINPAALAADPIFGSVHFDDPIHKYDAVEITLARRMSNNWQMNASYRWSRLRGNYEGFYRDDNGQSDPGISSLYDFPTNDPTYTSIGAAEFGYPGDIRYLGADGILPLDRPHSGKIFGNYTFPMGLNLGVGFNLSSGKPLTPLAANPNYSNGGEIPAAPRGSGIQTVEGFKKRTPFQSQVDFQAAYELKLSAVRRVSLMMDVFNVFNQQIVYDYDNYTELTYGAGTNPNAGWPTTSSVVGNWPQYQTPRQLRFGLRFQF
jgi:outer membrane receptor protein involved in Fe transport